MNYSVLLVQRGIVDTTHAVSGKSGKLYGTAVQTPGYGGVVLELPLELYMSSADDLIGSMTPGQQWVPHFISKGGTRNGVTSGGEDRGVCSIPSGCRLGPGGTAADADYVWQHYRFCAGHAPMNAKPLWEGAAPIYDGSALQPTMSSDVQNRIIDRGVGAGVTEKDGHTPPEVFSAPIVGSAGENQVPVGGTERPIPMPNAGGARRAVFEDPALSPQPASPEAAAPAVATVPKVQPVAQVQAPPAPRGPSAAEVIQQSVAAAVTAAMAGVLPQLKAHVETVVAGAIPKVSEKKARAKKEKGPPSLFQLSQTRAKELGMNVFGKSKEQMDQFIADHTAKVSSPESETAGIFPP